MKEFSHFPNPEARRPKKNWSSTTKKLIESDKKEGCERAPNEVLKELKNVRSSRDFKKIEFDKLSKCGAIKPRYTVKTNEIEEFIGRYLPSKNMGILIVSTSEGLMTHQTALEKNLGGNVIAYFY